MNIAPGALARWQTIPKELRPQVLDALTTKERAELWQLFSEDAIVQQTHALTQELAAVRKELASLSEQVRNLRDEVVLASVDFDALLQRYNQASIDMPSVDVSSTPGQMSSARTTDRLHTAAQGKLSVSEPFIQYEEPLTGSASQDRKRYLFLERRLKELQAMRDLLEERAESYTVGTQPNAEILQMVDLNESILRIETDIKALAHAMRGPER